jgi:hypothetical protein
MRPVGVTAASGLARRTVELGSNVASVVRNLIMDVCDSYRPEVHYMRGPGPKWRARLAPVNASIAKSASAIGTPPRSI